MAIGGNGFYIPVGHSNYFEESKNVVLPSDFLSKGKYVYHNAKFDLQVLRRHGLNPSTDVEDTMMMAHYVNEDEFSFELDNLARVYGCTRKATKISQAMKKIWDDTPIAAMSKYAIQDALTTEELYQTLYPRYDYYKELWESTDRDFMLLLAKMETKGILVDIPRCHDLELQCMDRMNQIVQEIGFDPSKPSVLRSKLFDEPPFGFGLKPLSFTPKKREPQVNKKFLENTNHPVCGLLLEYNELKKQLTSYFRPYQRLGDVAGRLHPSFKQHGTVTGRLSCADPNLQQVPRTSKVKEVFMPEDDCNLVEIDYSNLEMRLMAVYCNQPHLLKVFGERSGDVHQATADLIGVPRYDAKQANFTIGYGGGWEPLNGYIKKGEQESRKIIDDWHKAYPEIKKTSYAAQRACEQNNGVVRMWSGRERHFRFSNEYHKAFNAVLQGGGFEIVKRSLLKLDAAGFDIRNQVHDSVWLNIMEKEEVKEAEKIMEEWVEEQFGLPFFVESKVLRSRK